MKVNRYLHVSYFWFSNVAENQLTFYLTNQPTNPTNLSNLSTLSNQQVAT